MSAFQEGTKPRISPDQHQLLDRPDKIYSIVFLLFFMGSVWIFIWFYFLIQAGSSVATKSPLILIHAILQLLTTASFFVAGLGLLKFWPRWRLSYFFSVVFLLTSTAYSLLVLWPSGHWNASLMLIIEILSFALSGYLTFSMASFSEKTMSDRPLSAKKRPNRNL